MLAPLSNSNCALSQKKSIESAPGVDQLASIACATLCTTETNQIVGKENKENSTVLLSQGMRKPLPTFACVFVKPPKKDEMEQLDPFCREKVIGSDNSCTYYSSFRIYH